ncbi:MAG: hypothetical protein PHD48_03425, partial [Alphaproteobacteria bacterium]|nr:hypothetical protein [Alphaproteobacteria bacterium]
VDPALVDDLSARNVNPEQSFFRKATATIVRYVQSVVGKTQTIAADGTPDVAAIERRLTYIKPLMRDYGQLASEYSIKLAQRFPDLEPIIRYNSKHPNHQISVDHLDEIRQTKTGGLFSTMFVNPNADAKKVIDKIAKSAPDWEKQLARYDRAKAKQPLLSVLAQRSSRRVGALKDVCKAITSHHEAVGKPLTPDQQLEGVRHSVVTAMADKAFFEKMTASWKPDEKKAAREAILLRNKANLTLTR